MIGRCGEIPEHLMERQRLYHVPGWALLLLVGSARTIKYAESEGDLVTPQSGEPDGQGRGPQGPNVVLQYVTNRVKAWYHARSPRMKKAIIALLTPILLISAVAVAVSPGVGLYSDVSAVIEKLEGRPYLGIHVADTRIWEAVMPGKKEWEPGPGASEAEKAARSEELRRQYSREIDIIGVEVRAVDTGRPAEAAGVQVADVIMGVDETNIASTVDLERVIAKHSPGDEIRLHIARGIVRFDYERVSIPVELQ